MSLDHTDWHRVDALLDAALAVPAAERARWLDDNCGHDAALRARLARLLELAESDGGLPDAAALLDTAARPHSRAPDTVLPEGHLLGRYRILGLLGAGGMGRVYRALDTALGREIAIKAVAHAFRRDPASLRRFEREARLLATIAHPNVAAIHGFEVLDGAPYLILELVDGRTLDEVLVRGPLGLEEARAIAVQIAEALEEAHRKGVVHRDLKPSNVMLSPGGRVKVLDFGLAKSVPSPDAAEGDTPASLDTTASGTVLGTAPYMSPEQVRSADTDARADVWAFGCVLYEMLTGRRAFKGESIPDVLASVLRDEPDWTALPPATPPALRRLLRRCLRKDPARRLQDVGDARLELQELDDEEVAPPAAARPARVAWLALAAVVLAGVAGVTLMRGATPPPPAAAPAQLALELPHGLELADAFPAPFAFTPDGSRLIVVAGPPGGRTQLFARTVAEATPVALAGTEGAAQPFVAPDGRHVGFFADRKLKRVRLAGGPAVVLAEVGGNPRGAAWTESGEIVLAPSQTSPLVRLDERGGAPRPLTELAPGETSHRWPRVIPGTPWVVFTVGSEDTSYDEARIDAVALDTGRRVTVLRGAGIAVVGPGPTLLSVKGGRVSASLLDPVSATVGGPPQLVLDGVRYDARNGGAHLDVAGSGAAVYTAGAPTVDENVLALVGTGGDVRRLSPVARHYRWPRLSPDGLRAAAVVASAASTDLWVIDVTTSTPTQLTFGAGAQAPAWSPDGRRLAVALRHGPGTRIAVLDAESGRDLGTLLESPARVQPCAYSPDGRWLVAQAENAPNGWDLVKIPLDGAGRAAGAPQPLAATPFHETHAVVSPDGRFVAYESDELDTVVDVYVRSFPDGGHKVRVSSAGARWPRWASEERLHYWSTSDNRLIAVRGSREGERFAAGGAAALWPADPPSLRRLFVTPTYAGYDVGRGGDRVLVLETASPEAAPPWRHPVVLLGWADTLRSRLAR